MSTEILMPFQLAPDGSIAVTTDPTQQAAQHIESLLETAPGERVMVPQYGVPIKGAVFAPDDQTAVNNITSDIQTAMATFEPGITISAVNVSKTVGDPAGTGTIDLDWSINGLQNASATGVLTATVLIGGTVVES